MLFIPVNDVRIHNDYTKIRKNKYNYLVDTSFFKTRFETLNNNSRGKEWQSLADIFIAIRIIPINSHSALKDMV